MSKQVGERVPYAPGTQVWTRVGWGGHWVVVHDHGVTVACYGRITPFPEELRVIEFPAGAVTSRRPWHRGAWAIVRMAMLVGLGWLVAQ